MRNKRSLLIGGVGLVKGNVRDGGKAMVSICDELEPVFKDKNWLENAPFETISLIIRYGTNYSGPEIGKINKKYSELDVSIELPMASIRSLKYDELRQVFKESTIKVLAAVAEKYSLDFDLENFS